jgi:hypothetical protein
MTGSGRSVIEWDRHILIQNTRLDRPRPFLGPDSSCELKTDATGTAGSPQRSDVETRQKDGQRFPSSWENKEAGRQKRKVKVEKLISCCCRRRFGLWIAN